MPGNSGLTAFSLFGNALRGVGFGFFDDRFDLFDSKLRCSLLFFFWQLVVAEALFDIGTVGAAQELDLFLFEDLDGPLLFGCSFLHDYGGGLIEAYRIGVELLPQRVELTVVRKIW